MTEPPAMLAAPDDHARAALRQGVTYILRSLRLLSDLMDGEIVTGLVFMALGQANVAHVDAGDGPGAYDRIDTIPPDAVRRPVSVLALASSLGLPYETTRRHVDKLVKRGDCKRVKGGVILLARALDSDQNRQVLVANVANLRRLVRCLKKAGIDLD